MSRVVAFLAGSAVYLVLFMGVAYIANGFVVESRICTVEELKR